MLKFQTVLKKNPQEKQIKMKEKGKIESTENKMTFKFKFKFLVGSSFTCGIQKKKFSVCS